MLDDLPAAPTGPGERLIFLDAHATTPVDPRALDAMLPYFSERFGNASSRTHAFGWQAAKAVERARRQVAHLIGARPQEVVFTSGATESNNLALLGAARALRQAGTHVVTVSTEHRAVLDPCRQLEAEGFRVTRLPVAPDGRLDLDRFVRALTPDTVLVSVMTANNEIGVLQPMEQIGRIARERGITTHTDAAQAAGKVPVDVRATGVDLLSLTAHKLYGPKGVGALYVRPGTDLQPVLFGGGHERTLRSGTLNVPGIVGFGAAAEIAAARMDEDARALVALRDRLSWALRQAVEGVRVNGSMSHRLPHNLNVSFAGIDGEALLTGITQIAVSSGAACSTGEREFREPSHVLRALGLDDRLARASLRFGLLRTTTAEEVDRAAAHVAGVVGRLRQRPAFEALPDDPAAHPTGWLSGDDDQVT